MRMIRSDFALLVGCLAAALLNVSGCRHVRNSGSVSVDGGVHSIITSNRYKLLAVKFGEGVDATQGNMQSMASFNASLAKHQPGVFSGDGIPFVISEDALIDDPPSSGGIAGVLSAVTLTLLPQCYSFGGCQKFTLDVLDNPDARATFELRTRQDNAMSIWTPLPLMWYTGDPADVDGWEQRSVATLHSREFLFGDMSSAYDYNELREEAMAYALAALLKKLEEDGLVDKSRSRDATWFTKQAGSFGDSLDIMDFKKDDGYGHRYSFAVRIRGGRHVSIRESRAMQEEIRAKIREDYVASFPGVAARSLVVDFPEFSLRNGVITGSAVVLSLSAESLRYDPGTHTGMMRVRIGEGQFEDARRYARRNIEILVRDKNVALDARAIPSAATFYTHDEALKGDVLEISFKTE